MLIVDKKPSPALNPLTDNRYRNSPCEQEAEKCMCEACDGWQTNVDVQSPTTSSSFIVWTVSEVVKER